MGLFDFLRSSDDDASPGDDDVTLAGAGSEHRPARSQDAADDVVFEPAVPSTPEAHPDAGRGIQAVEVDERTEVRTVVETVTTDDDGAVGAGHLALTDLGRRLSDTWLREELGDRLEADDPGPTAALETAFLTGALSRHLVVNRTAAGSETVDESLSGPDFSVDDVDINNAGEHP